MSIKALTRKLAQLERKARKEQELVEFILYTNENPPPEGTEVDFVIDLLAEWNGTTEEDDREL